MFEPLKPVYSPLAAAAAGKHTRGDAARTRPERRAGLPQWKRA